MEAYIASYHTVQGLDTKVGLNKLVTENQDA